MRLFPPSKRLSRYIIILLIILATASIGIYHHEKVKEHLANIPLESFPGFQIFDASSDANKDSAIEETNPDSWMDTKYENIFRRLNTPLIDNITNSEEDKEKQIISIGIEESYMKKTLKTPVIEPKIDNLVRPGDPLAGKANAAILSLVREEDLKELVLAINRLEERFNSKFNYPYVFLNDGDFSDKFVTRIKDILPKDRIIEFGKIDPEVWNMPDNIDRDLFKEAIEKNKNVQFMAKESYHNMCRFFSKNFYKHPLVKKYKYTWRLEPSTSVFCDIEYDVFQFMEMNDKYYGYTISVYDSPESVATLWNHTMDFLKMHPDYIDPNGAFEWLKDNGQKPENYEIANGYSTCHFWTNFEITNLEFLRSKPYEQFVEYLDSKDGFYYERWGDAPVRSLALALFLDKKKIHWFQDIGYLHTPYTNCPASPVGSKRCQGNCIPGRVSAWEPLSIENCQGLWLEYSMDDKTNLYTP
ncbi:hypothetical protein TPHA_0I01910 [Tetrapisispora phaffii CBS 4417]|uniref:Glycosyltransferase family 15 protein n=1 Tax=Tetrapisispora phaffii (strain ATCC 24235 / CBS 4417 / NBRC 1672 / NRRL Y-8282 / UCD 70-5) TaxID=1071381 RepID=G8BXR7_TETPH|nr:hypothetical protein TPHA_0I01910 [Tetrapisispora phaffii CBS 4417]CCE64695.1 hypothetical protein TPHA_0I01910 [Tetrapisispora phaffii CBS 4417]